MSDSIRERLQVAVSAEPAVGDPYARFVHRRRVSRGLRVLSGVLLFGLTMVGFVTVFPGGVGGRPDDSLIPGPGRDPRFDTFDIVADASLGVRMGFPDEWQVLHEEGERVRVGPVLALGDAAPTGFELRIGDLGGCPASTCTALEALVDDRAAASEAGLSLHATKLRVGAVNVDAVGIRFPSPGREIAPWCPGCVGTYAELGSRGVPLLVIAPDRESFRAAQEMLRLVLGTLVAQ